MESHLEKFGNTSSGVWRGCCPKRISKRHVGKEKHCSVSVSMLCHRPMRLRLSSCHVATPPGGMNMRPQKVGLSKTMSFSSWNKSILNKSRVLSIADSNNSSHRPKKGMYQVILAPLDATDCTPRGKTYKVGPIALWIFIVMNKFYALVIFSNQQKYCLVIKHGNEQSTIYS